MTELTCVSCGHRVDPASRRHVQTFRDLGHAPLVIRELEPEREQAVTKAMNARPGR